jgi:glycosyltransferase involved in cell wall biosynthesis
MVSGVGIQSNKFLRGLNKTGLYDIVHIAGSLYQQNPTPIIYEGIKIYPISTPYGDPQTLKQILHLEQPDIILAFSDPRFYEYLFMMDDAIRKDSKLIFYHTWDNEPFPKFNLPWYEACDEIVMLSEFSHKLLLDNGVSCHCITHGFDPSEFYILPKEIVDAERKKIFEMAGSPNAKFLIFWNNRNITRKRPGDVLMAFKRFSETHPDSVLFMNTEPLLPEGTNLPQVYEDLNISQYGGKVVFNFNKLQTPALNVIYNAADATLTITHSEGFGLCVGESLMAGTPVIATRTGGIPEQMSRKSEQGEEVFGILMDPDVRHLFGVPGAPYIYQDYVSFNTIEKALATAYDLAQHGKWKPLGEAGREFVIRNYHTNQVVDNWHKLLQEVASTPSMYKAWKLHTL